MRRILSAGLASAAVLAAPAAVVACPFCGTETSEQVRAALFNDSFWVNAAMVLAPFPLVLAIIGGLHLAFNPRSGNGESQAK